MELNRIFLNRRSVRKFTDEPVSDEEIELLLHAAMSAPSACNKRPWEFYVVTDEEMLARLRRSSPYTRYAAKLAIVVCGSLTRSLPMQLSDFWIQDCSAATENILLCAADIGLGAVWCGLHPQKNAVKKVAEVLSLPAKHVPLNIIFIGRPAEFPEPRDQYEEKRVHFVK